MCLFVYIGDTRGLVMSSIITAEDAETPFGVQSMQTVLDRLQFNRLRDTFLTKQQILNQGVLITSARNYSDPNHKDFMKTKLIGVADKSGAQSYLAHVSFDRPPTGSSKQAHGRARPRNGKIFASRARISKFLAMVTELPVGSKFAGCVEFYNTAYYWEYFHPQTPLYVHPYTDIDFKMKNSEELKFDDVWRHVDKARRLMTEALLAGCDRDNLEVMVLFCRRICGDHTKFSFHLHWPEVIMDDMSTLAALVRQVNAQCPKQPGGADIIDTAPYGSNQLLRGPYCGKYKEGLAAALMPIRIATVVENDGSTRFVHVPDTTTPRWEIISKSCICTPFDEASSSFVHVVINMVPRVLARNPQAGVVPVANENKKDYAKWMGFWMPILQRFIIPNFVVFRQHLARASGVVVTFPDTTSPLFTASDVRRVQGYPASFRVTIEGDTFCEYDNGATPHVHNFNHNAISYVVDLHKGKIFQQCVKCRPVGPAIKWYHFIKYDDLTFDILDADVAETLQTDFVTVKPTSTRYIAFFMQFFYEQVVYARDVKQVLVYDKMSGTWKGGLDGNGLVLSLINQLNAHYRDYTEVRNQYICNKTLADWRRNNPSATEEERDDKRKKCMDACRKHNQSIGDIWRLTVQSRQTLLKSLQPDVHPHQVDTMEPNANLVPLLNGQCIDVFTWHQRAIKPTDYFVSCLNSEICSIDDDDVNEFTSWQYQVCCGDDDYLKYKLRIMGLSLTMFNFDRAFYMPLGPVGRNGKSSESHLFNEVTMKITPARGYYISREYLTKQGQDRKGANAADTVMMDLANKTIIIADECRDTLLDGALIKTLVSGDTTSGRNLYETERSNINNKGTLWIIANSTLKLDYTDAALMDRLRILPYNARWVSNPSDVQSKMNDISQSMWVFQDDPFFKEKKLNKWTSAMTTKCLYELHCFLKSLPSDPEDPSRPAKLQRIPVPQSIVKFTKEKIAKEHPVLSFITTYMGITSELKDFATVELVFSQFMRFGKNENSSRIRHMPRPVFQEAMLKEDIDVIRGEDGINRFNGWKMVKDVPNLDKDDLDADALHNSFYVPPPIQPDFKRARHNDDM